MIERFSVQNFLSYHDEMPIELSKLNVFVGTNSSGKSTVLHALALLSETAGDSSDYTSLLFAGNGLNLGTFRDAVHANDTAQSISFEIAISKDMQRLAAAGRVSIDLVPDRYRLFFREDPQSGSPYISAISAYTAEGRRCFTMQGHATKTTPGMQKADFPQFDKRPAGVVPRIRHFLPYFQLPDAVTGPRNAKRVAPFAAVNRLSDAIGDLFERAVYIGPSRSSLDVVYFPVGRYPTKLDSTGSNAVPLILGTVRQKRERARFAKTLQHWLGDRFGLVSKSNLRGVEEGLGFRFEGEDPLMQATVLLSNTGYGVSQVLPIVVQLALGNPCLLLIEQPEIHLHPRAQAELANLLVTFAERGYQLVVETHSEHLILRLRSLMAQKKTSLSPSDVCFFHVEKTEAGSIVNRVELEASGGLKGWPRNFFSASSDDLVELLKRGGA